MYQFFPAFHVFTDIIIILTTNYKSKLMAFSKPISYFFEALECMYNHGRDWWMSPPPNIESLQLLSVVKIYFFMALTN